MKLIKPHKLGLLSKTYRFRQSDYLSVAPLLFFDLGTGVPLIEMPQWLKVTQSLETGQAMDIVMPKVRGEVLIAGTAFAPEGKPTPKMEIGFTLGPLKKRLMVTGDRMLHRRLVPSFQITDPEPFVKMPVSTDRAFGGEGHSENPQGTGYESRWPTAHKPSEVPLPNIEVPGKSMKRPGQRVPFAHLGPVSFQSPKLQKKAGTYNKKWMLKEHPGYPKDIDWSIFNVAPEDQQLTTFFQGGEAFSIFGMHPEKSTLTGHLPCFRVRVFVEQIHGGRIRFSEISTQADTVWFFPEHMFGVMIYRGTLGIGDSDALDIQTMMLAYENSNDPSRSKDYYQNALELRTNPKTAMAHMLNESQLSPQKSDAQKEQERAEQVTADQQALERAQEVINESAKEMLAKQELPKDFEIPKAKLPLLGTVPPEALKRGDVCLEGIFENADKLIKQAKTDAQDMYAKALLKAGDASLIEKRLPFTEEQMKDFKAQAKAKKEELNPVKPLSSRLAPLAKELHPDHQLAFTKLIESAPKSADVDQHRLYTELQLRKSRQQALTPTYPKDDFSEEDGKRLGQLVRDHLDQGGSLTGNDLSGADLRGINFSGMDLRQTMFEKADLRECDFSESNLEGAVFTGAVLDNAKFTKAQLVNTNFCGSQGKNISFEDCDASQSRWMKAKLEECDFSGSLLHQVQAIETHFSRCRFNRCQSNKGMFLEAELGECQWDQGALEACILLKANLRKAAFRETKMRRSMLVNVQAEAIDFSNAEFEKVQAASDAVFKEARFDGVKANTCGWRNVDFTGASFEKAVMVKSDFGNALFHDAKMKESSFYRSIFMGAKLINSDLEEADFLDAILRKSDFTQANLKKANLYQADTSEACFQEADLDEAVLFNSNQVKS